MTEDITERILRFLRDIGLEVRDAELQADTFLLQMIKWLA